MQIDRYDFELPHELIASRPVQPRDTSKLLIINRKDQSISIHNFAEIIDCFNSNDLIIFNNTKVNPYLLNGLDSDKKLREFLLIQEFKGNKWSILTKKPKASRIIFNDDISASMFKNDGDWFLQFDKNPSDYFKTDGFMPIPPYLNRKSDSQDKIDYQTVYAEVEGSIAAPTAGLHFSKEIFNKLNTNIDFITLHVGMGTFLPIKAQDVDSHHMHSEKFFIKQKLVNKIDIIKKNKGKIVSIGTTSLRALESSYNVPGDYDKWSSTSLFIKEGFEFKVVDSLLTNFHLPKSTLLILVSAFAGYDLIMRAYKMAIENKFRFYSYGDAMLIL
ncbi:MAG: tRNA preQ1(34) S-adenosylmethionine ribosyltransferase-isomerase QueA [Deltaproteobacteria bacterium TMED126]|nr:tRNA preQ1(34) S-adenosylmethionine ribosyltransferase-isomerase QueA [Deltaproteobacteria bacterium TMED126]